MTLFTNNPLERMMRQIPRAGKSDEPPRVTAPEGHHCYGCGHYGLTCVRPCYRDTDIRVSEDERNHNRKSIKGEQHDV